MHLEGIQLKFNVCLCNKYGLYLPSTVLKAPTKNLKKSHWKTRRKLNKLYNLMAQINSLKYVIIFLLFSYNVKANEETKWSILI
jgi:hypothetical protein